LSTAVLSYVSLFIEGTELEFIATVQIYFQTLTFPIQCHLVHLVVPGDHVPSVEVPSWVSLFSILVALKAGTASVLGVYAFWQDLFLVYPARFFIVLSPMGLYK
jgi:hypothetical protein